MNYGPASWAVQPTGAIPNPSRTLVSSVLSFVIGAPFQGPQVFSTQQPYVQQPQIPLLGVFTILHVGPQIRYGPNPLLG